MKRIFTCTILSALILLCLSAVSLAANFTAGNLVVCRVGAIGGGALGSAATAVFLDEYTTAGSLVQSIPMPVADASANQILTVSGTATSECLLTRSADAKYLLIMGYDAAVGTASITSSSTTGGTPIVRVIGRIGNNGVVDTTTTTTSFSGGNPRGIASSNGTDIWLTGSNTGIVYTTFGSSGAGTIVSTTVTNNRAIGVFAGQLYSSDSSGTAVRLGTVGSGLPTTTGQTITNLPGFPANTGSPYAFFFADQSAAVAGVDTVYVADDAAGLQKYSLVAGNWTLNGTVTPNIRGLTGVQLSASVILYGTSTTASGNTLATYVDTSGYNARPTPLEVKGRGSNEFVPGTPTVIATAGTNTVFRGVAFAPLPLTAASATISGRVAEANGRGIANAVITLSGGELTEPITVATGNFGYFTFSDLPVGANYVLTVSAKRHRFAEPTRLITLQDDFAGADFIANL